MIKNMDKDSYKLVKMLAVKEEKPVGEVMSEAVRFFFREKNAKKKKGFRHLPIIDLGPGTENLSMEIDDILYGEMK